ncbi:MAG: helix-turn-helix domain-containing protein [Treponema sp.]|jgi:transcriptional regulator with XRE-family HTH domain|nr:helix-turn-helix domain-containing protein [Treponema sp.]
MTRFQQLFVRNLRFFRKERGISQLKFSELINISPNYLNAVENGKNFPSPEVIQRIIDILNILPYQLFLEHPLKTGPREGGPEFIHELTRIKERFVKEIEEVIRKYAP